MMGTQIVDMGYVTELLLAADAKKIKTRREWDDLTYPDRAAGYGPEIAEAERVYFSKGRK